MQRYLLVFWLFVASLLLLSFSACEENSTDPSDGEVFEANVLAAEGIQMLNQTMIDMDDTQDITEAEDLMLQQTFNEIQAKFDAAMDLDPNNPTANLGMSILDFVVINYDQELWDMINDIKALDDDSPRILNRQIQFFAETPSLLIKQFQPTRTDAISIHRLQSYIISGVLPRLSDSLARLNHAIALADSNAIMIDTSEEYMEVDCGEIHAFRAAMNLIFAAFNMIVAYDMDIKDRDNSYDWVQDFADIEMQQFPEGEVYDFNLTDGHLILYYYDWDYAWELYDLNRTEFLARLLQHNLEHNASFGTIASQNYLNAARNAIIAAADDVRNGTDYILDENDNQDNDVIKIENILSMNDNFDDIDENDPSFMQDWNSINDVADWIESILSQSFELQENNVEFSVDLSAYFSGNIADIRDVQPYFNWNENEDWISHRFYTDTTTYYSNYSFWMNDQFYEFDNLNRVTWNYAMPKLIVGDFTDAQGNVIDEDEIPYFPDYTFGGILPDMTRAKFIQLFE